MLNIQIAYHHSLVPVQRASDVKTFVFSFSVTLARIILTKRRFKAVHYVKTRSRDMVEAPSRHPL